MPTETELAYIAGLIDGEGSILLISRKKYQVRVRNWTCRVTISNTHLETLQWVQQRLGGNIGLHKAKNPKHRDHYSLRWDSRQAIDVVRAVRKFLLIKQRQAAVLMAYDETILHRQGRRGYGERSHEVEQIRVGLYERMRMLNQKGREALCH